MKIVNYIFCGILLIWMLACNKPVYDFTEKEIVIGCGESFDVSYSTKATPVTSIPSSLYWGATTGSGSESVKWSAASATVSSSQIHTGKYQTYSPTSYNFYVANQSFTPGGNMTVANNGTDIIAGRTAGSSSTSPSVTLNHIFARTGTFTCNTQSGYSISNISWTITSYGSVTGTAGTFNMASQSWTSRSAALSETTVTSSSDYFLLPGEYTVKVTYTLTLGDYAQTFTKSGRVTLVAGKINNISCTANGGSATEIAIGLSLTAWSSTSHAINIS